MPRWTARPTVSLSPRSRGRRLQVMRKISIELKGFLSGILCSGNKPENYRDLDTQVQSNVKVIDGALVLKNVQKASEGYYLCKATNGIGRGLSAVIYISIQGKSWSISICLSALTDLFQLRRHLRSRREAKLLSRESPQFCRARRRERNRSGSCGT